MRVLIQRVLEANVVIEGQVHNSIKNGLVLFVGFTNTDDISVVDRVINKINGLRILEDSNQKMNVSINDGHIEILSISQFTLYASVKKGKRPSFDLAAKPEVATKLYDYFNEELSKLFIVKTGIFQADMKVSLVNDGPLTIMIDSDEL